MAASFSRQQGGGVDQGKAALGFKGAGERFPGAHPRGYIFQLRAEGGVLLAFDQHVERANNGQAGPDQGEELLVEDDEGFQVCALAAAAYAAHAARANRVDVVAGLGETAAQFFRGAGDLHLLLNASPLICQLDYVLCHGPLTSLPGYSGRCGRLGREAFPACQFDRGDRRPTAG